MGQWMDQGKARATAEEAEILSKVIIALDIMTPRQKEAWAMRLGRDGTDQRSDYKEVAVAMGISQRAVHRLMDRGLKLAAKMLREKPAKLKI